MPILVRLGSSHAHHDDLILVPGCSGVEQTKNRQQTREPTAGKKRPLPNNDEAEETPIAVEDDNMSGFSNLEFVGIRRAEIRRILEPW